MKMRDILLFSQYSVIFAKSKTHDFDVSHEKLYGNDIIFSLKFPLAFFCRLLYHNREHNWINCLRGGAKFPTGSDSLRAAAAAGTGAIPVPTV